jgi:phage terminase small subunit
MDLNFDFKTRHEIASIRLTAMQKRFAELYIELFNWDEAYRQAGYTGGLTQRKRVRDHKGINQYIEILKREISRRVDISPEDILRELTNIAFLDMGDLATWVGADEIILNDSEQLTPELRKCVQEISCTETPKGKTVKMKVYNKLEALRELRSWLEIIEEGKKVKKPTGAPLLNVNNFKIELADPAVRSAIELLSGKLMQIDTTPMPGKLKRQIALLTNQVKQTGLVSEAEAMEREVIDVEG